MRNLTLLFLLISGLSYSQEHRLDKSIMNIAFIQVVDSIKAHYNFLITNDTLIVRNYNHIDYNYFRNTKKTTIIPFSENSKLPIKNNEKRYYLNFGNLEFIDNKLSIGFDIFLISRTGNDFINTENGGSGGYIEIVYNCKTNKFEIDNISIEVKDYRESKK